MHRNIPTNMYGMYREPTGDGLLGAFGAFIVIFIVFILAVAFISYVINGILYMKLSKKANVEPSWVAWVPYGPQYLITRLAKINPMMMLIPFASASLLYLTENILIIGVLGIVLFGYSLYTSRKIFENFGKNPDMAFLIFIPFIGGIIILVNYFMIAFGEAEFIFEPEKPVVTIEQNDQGNNI